MTNRRQTLVVPPRQYEAIGHLAALGADRVEKLGNLSAAEAISLDLEGLSRRMSETIQTPAHISGAIIGLLMSLNDVRADRNEDPESFVRGLTVALTEQATQDWKDKHLKDWEAISQRIPSLLRPNGFFSLFRKAYELALNHPATVASLQILSDVRPLYDDAAENIRALVLSHVLALRIQEGSDVRILHVTLDAGDVRKLASELARAAQKEKTLEQRASTWGIPVIQFDSET